MSHEFTVTVDDMMADFISDMEFADDDLSDSIFTCVDNFIDDLIIKAMDDEASIMNSDRDDPDVPFNYVVDQVLKSIDGNSHDDFDGVYDSEDRKYNTDITTNTSYESDSYINSMDPDYCEDVNFSDISAEDFQMAICVRDDPEENFRLFPKYDSTTYDAIYGGN